LIAVTTPGISRSRLQAVATDKAKELLAVQTVNVTVIHRAGSRASRQIHNANPVAGFKQFRFDAMRRINPIKWDRLIDVDAVDSDSHCLPSN
jgi:hypothetical protein